MDFKRDVMVGIVFFAAIALLLMFTVVIEDFGLVKEKGDEIVVHFADVGGLQKGQKVRVSGMEVGWVKHLVLLDDNRVEARLVLKRPVGLGAGYQFQVRDVSPLGGKYVEIVPGDPAKGKPEKLEGTAAAGALKAVGDIAEENRQDLRRIVASIRRITESLADGKGTLGKLVVDPTLHDRVAGTFDDLRFMTRWIREGKGSIGKLWREDGLYRDLAGTLAEVKGLISDIRTGDGTLARLVKSDALHRDLQGTLGSVRQAADRFGKLAQGILDGKGSLGKLYREETLHESLNGALVEAKGFMSEARQIAGKINRGVGTLGRLVNEDALYTRIAGLVDDVGAVAASLRSGKGTLGKLLADDSLYVELRSAVRSISQTVEDARELAPVQTFTNILFSAF